MRILYVVGRYWPATGGGPLHLRGLANRLHGRHEVTVAALCNTDDPDAFSYHNVSRARSTATYQDGDVNIALIGLSAVEAAALRPWVPFCKMAKPARATWKYLLRTFLARKIVGIAKNCDLIHNVQVGPDALTWAAFNASRKLGVPFVHTPLLHPSHNPGWLARIYSRADAVVALTHQEKERLIRLGVERSRAHVIPVGPLIAQHADGTEFREKHGISGPMVLFVGRHERYKGYLELLSATELVWERFPNTHFVWVGPSDAEARRHFDTRQDSRVRYLGIIDLQEKSDALAACDILCVPSTEESLGMVYLEAWLCAKPVIACDIPAVRELVASGEDSIGILVEQDSKQIAEAICHLIGHPSLRKRMGEKGRAKVAAQYSWNGIVSKMERLYSQLVNARGSAAQAQSEES